MLNQVIGPDSRVAASARGRWNSQQWAALCASRLIELRPRANAEFLRATALEMATTLSYFDPALAAEMEHEAGVLDD